MPLNAVITAIRVQDIVRGVWYNWDSGSWDAGGAPSCNTLSSLYIAFYATNEMESGECLFEIVDTNTGTVYAQKQVLLPAYASDGIEWTGTMPAAALNITCRTSQVFQ